MTGRAHNTHPGGDIHQVSCGPRVNSHQSQAAQDPLPQQVVRSWPPHTYPFLSALLHIFTLQAFWPVQAAKETDHCRGKEPQILPPRQHASLVPVLPWPQATSLGQRLETRACRQGPQQSGEHSKHRARPGQGHSLQGGVSCAQPPRSPRRYRQPEPHLPEMLRADHPWGQKPAPVSLPKGQAEEQAQDE